ncbi:MAG: pantoate--beta-alanine ligase [Bradymonadaceae bacterium]
MELHERIPAFRQARRQLEGTVALVPTMGALHEAHRSLMREGRRQADHLVVSIFVNPTQFGPGSDYDKYPRDLQRDRRQCQEVGCSLVFAPPADEMYADDASTSVRVSELTDGLCGAHRPGHFEGVTNVVAKLFNIVEPDVAVFGEKDYQQLVVIRQMVRDLNFPVEIVGAPTVRENDGLAVSSRNRYLDDEERRRASALSSALADAWRAYRDGVRDPAAIEGVVEQRLRESVDAEAIEYVECVDAETLEPLDSQVEEGTLIAVAVHVGSARLIDNIRLDRPLPDELRAD